MTLLRLAPTLVSEAIASAFVKVIDFESLRNGVQYFVGPLLNWTLVGVMKAIAAEIERLQNVLANQRLSQSRTALDDNEYVNRFDRLDGAIKNLAFEIRQSWKVIPGWLQPVINQGAEVKGGREMTVVGRAAISRWVVDEILDRFFHPGLDPLLSSHLKTIEHNIRRCGPPPP